MRTPATPRHPARTGPPRVLVVDDSAVVRQALAQILTRAGMEVTVAADPIVATERMRRSRPDAMVLDLEMPRMHGLAFLRRVMAADPLPVVVCSGHAAEATDLALQALEEGAVEVIAKPGSGVREFLHDSALRLVEAVQGALQARPRRSVPPSPKLGADAVLPAPRPPPVPLAARAGRVVALGASIGGTEALREILQALPADAPAILAVQHMPEGYTAPFARRLAQLCRPEVKEAASGDRVAPGRVLIAPGNRHLAMRRSGDGYRVDLLDGPPVCRHRPSVDVLFRSVAGAAGPAATGVLLTGMGDDGAEGLLELRQAGARTIAQDEATSVVFGMPKEAIARGAAAEVLPLPRIAGALLRGT